MSELPIPPHFDPTRTTEVWRVPYQERAADAASWARELGLRPAAEDRVRIGLLAIDVQNTFCLPDFELFVGGPSGRGAVEDAVRLCRFVYRNLHRITRIVATLDTHTAAQIFHPLFLVGPDGEPPSPGTPVSLEDVEAGRWRANPALAGAMGLDPEALDAHLLHYCRTLQEGGKYGLMVWPYHAMLGGVGHALVPAVEEAFFFHSVARSSPIHFEIKGRHALTEHYSALRPEVTTDADGGLLAGTSEALVDLLLGFDVLLVAGEAKSHCVAWTVEDLLQEIRRRDPSLARRVYLLEDCTSPVVVPGVVDFTEEAEEAFARFEAAGMHRVRSAQPMEEWLEVS